MSRSRLDVLRRREPLRVGFLPLSDAAPIIYASEAGLFEKYGLEVQLQRERSWVDIRDKVINGDLDVAQAPATLPFLANLGLESDPCACVSGLVLSLEGNAITLSRSLWERGVVDAEGLREKIYQQWHKHTFTFGVAFPFSTQELLLRRWLRSGGILPETEVRIVTIPPAEMYPTLRLGYIDGFCAGEPWTSVAVEAGAGVCVAVDAELCPLHPEKVLMARQSFALGRSEEHERMLAALLEAAAVCDQPANRLMLGEMLAHHQYVNAPAELVRAGLPHSLQRTNGRIGGAVAPAIFDRQNAGDPTDEKAQWVMEALYELAERNTLRSANPERTPVLKNIFRRDIYFRALAMLRGRRIPKPADANGLGSLTANAPGRAPGARAPSPTGFVA